MRKKKIDEAELPSANLAMYQLVSKESGGIINLYGFFFVPSPCRTILLSPMPLM